MVHALDPDAEGKILWQTRVGAGGLLGGSQWGSAADDQRIYVAISDVVLHSVVVPSAKAPRLRADAASRSIRRIGGGLHAIDLKSGAIVWSARPAKCPATQAICSPAQSAAVTAIAGAVFSGSLDGHMRAYSTTDGRVIWDFNTARNSRRSTENRRAADPSMRRGSRGRRPRIRPFRLQPVRRNAWQCTAGILGGREVARRIL